MCRESMPMAALPHEQAAQPRPATVPTRFGRDKRGNVAIIFALCCFVVVSLIGGAVDFGRTIAFKGKMQNALDSASLAAGSAYALDANHNVELALAQAQRYFDAIIAGENGAVLTKDLNTESQTVTLTATAQVPTPFLSLAGIQQVSLSAASTSTTTETLGGSGDYEVELSLMLDVTGSMAWDAGDGTIKIDALKAAAKELIDILVPASGKSHARIGLAPFSSRINLGDYAMAVTGQPATKTVTSSYQCNKQETCQPATCREYYDSGKNKGTCKRWNDPVCSYTYDTCTSDATNYLYRCMTERTGTEAFKDTAPTSGFTATYKSSEDSAINCTPNSNYSVMGMTTNASALKERIDNFQASGSTAGHLGVAWAWYLLSPNWSGVFTGDSAPKAYGTAKNKKIAVLMTDGQFNTYYASGQGDSIAQAKSLCDAMKANNVGIEVYTIGFKLDDATAAATLQYCATDSSHYFEANDADQLMSSFREIAYRSVPLHLSK